MPNEELEELKQAVESEEDETTDDNAPASNEESSDEGNESEEESVESLKVRLKKAEEDRDNYKRIGLSIKKAERRSLDISEKSDASPEAPDISEEKVLSVIYKQNEKAAMKAVINPNSSMYLQELVDDKQFQTIVSEYLPRNVDKSSLEGIHKALRIAIAAWKVDNGIISEKKVDTKSAKAKLTESSAETHGDGKVEVKKERKRLLTNTGTSPKDWYK